MPKGRGFRSYLVRFHFLRILASTLTLVVLAVLTVSCHPQAETKASPTSSPATETVAPVLTATTSVLPRNGSGSVDRLSGLKWVSPLELPKEGQQILRLITQGGPFRYSKDGVTFGNREGILPKQNRGYYREYTVKTPEESDRGARRIICGGQPITSVKECYYTTDHYSSFRRISP